MSAFLQIDWRRPNQAFNPASKWKAAATAVTVASRLSAASTTKAAAASPTAHIDAASATEAPTVDLSALAELSTPRQVSEQEKSDRDQPDEKEEQEDLSQKVIGSTETPVTPVQSTDSTKAPETPVSCQKSLASVVASFGTLDAFLGQSAPDLSHLNSKWKAKILSRRQLGRQVWYLTQVTEGLEDRYYMKTFAEFEEFDRIFRPTLLYRRGTREAPAPRKSVWAEEEEDLPKLPRGGALGALQSLRGETFQAERRRGIQCYLNALPQFVSVFREEPALVKFLGRDGNGRVEMQIDEKIVNESAPNPSGNQKDEDDESTMCSSIPALP
jgi:hypothetical protein